MLPAYKTVLVPDFSVNTAPPQQPVIILEETAKRLQNRRSRLSLSYRRQRGYSRSRGPGSVASTGSIAGSGGTPGSFDTSGRGSTQSTSQSDNEGGPMPSLSSSFGESSRVEELPPSASPIPHMYMHTNIPHQFHEAFPGRRPYNPNNVQIWGTPEGGWGGFAPPMIAGEDQQWVVPETPEYRIKRKVRRAPNPREQKRVRFGGVEEILYSPPPRGGFAITQNISPTELIFGRGGVI